MKVFLKAVCCAFVVCCLLSMTGFYGACEDISEEVFRLHVIAHSDSEQEQSLKLRVRDALVRETAALFEKCESKEDAMRLAGENQKQLQACAQRVVRESGFDHPVAVSVTKAYFNTRVYDSFTLPAGEYDALRVVIGSGRGKNWWCVLFPSLCFSAAGSGELDRVMNDGEQAIITEPERYEVRFGIVEWFENICSWFR